jgi:diaminohydroxyphosphoribosylaminopyrimidine deaminase/5-amino-6-(5-phosphoribosylamino)uracil reductase
MDQAELDRKRISEALALAATAIGHTEPNPRVGCVVGMPDGRILGSGATQPPGYAHAEIMALVTARAAGIDVRGATAWVTLEPCAHQGRTPPCCDALIAAGLARVVVAVTDPNPAVAGQGIARLRAAGIVVDGVDADLAAAAWEINIGFFSRMVRGRPWVRMKLATSLDGRTALPNGRSQWITGADARADGHAWRRRATAILTGIGTVLSDDPLLDVRLAQTAATAGSPPMRVVADSQLRTPVTARLLDGAGACLIVAADRSSAARARADALASAGAEVAFVTAGADGRLDLDAMLSTLAARQVNELHVEAGAGLSGALVQACHVDELLVYLAPTVLGPGRGWVDWPALHSLEGAPQFEWLQTHIVGSDLRLRLLRAGDNFLSTPAVECRPA